MDNIFLVITSIANDENPVLRKLADESKARKIPFIVMGDTKSPDVFNLEGCDFYSIARQNDLRFELAGLLPTKHYARKNLGYLVALAQGADVIVETDDDNLPLPEFWNKRSRTVSAHLITRKEWINVYKYFTEAHIWPRGFALENIPDILPALEPAISVNCPIQQGLADGNPDVDAIYRLILPLPVKFNRSESIALGEGSVCPFNSQNTTWFKETFALLYLPSYCSFRMTDIWRSFVAQRIAWTCGWKVLFHQSTVSQERNDHNLMNDFSDEIPGYINNAKIYSSLRNLSLKGGYENIPDNMKICYEELIRLGYIDQKEISLLNAWLNDIKSIDKT